MSTTSIPACAFETFRGVVFPWFCDSMGHMATQHYMGLYDHALFHVVGKLGPVIGGGEGPSGEGGARLGWADIRHDVRYLAELLAGDLVVIRSHFLRFGTSSVAHRSYLVREADGAVCSTLEAVTVRFDLDARKAVPIAPALVAAGQAYLAPEP